MQVLSILAHPRADSFCHAIAETANAAVQNLGHDVVFHDLYGEGFDPILRGEEAYTVGETIEQTVAKARDPIVLRHRKDVADADGLIVVHPNWWGKPPAILSGWLDRVLVPGVAYRLEAAEGEPEGLLSIRRALIINTSDTPEDRENEVLGDPLRLIWENCVLPYCGVKSVDRHVFRPVAGSRQQERRDWLASVENIAHTNFGDAALRAG